MLLSRHWPTFRALITLTFIAGYVGLCIAGESGSVYLINLSGSHWNLTRLESHGMDNWQFPDLLKHGDSCQVFVEFKHITNFISARAEYELVRTGGKCFHISAHGKPHQLEVVYTNLKIDDQPKGMKRSLRWRQNGETNLIIIGKNGKYTGTNLDGSNWMKNNMDVLGMRTLKEICIPGSHDSGMNELSGHTHFGRPCNSLTQSHSIGEQLKLGIRYFDIRPVIANGGNFVTGHYTYFKQLGYWQGGNGQYICSIVEELNFFTKDHNELIIIKVSHSLNTALGSRDYRKLNQREWGILFKELDLIQHLYRNNNTNVDLKKIKLSEYTDNGSKASVVLIIDDPEPKVELGCRMGNGYFLPRNLVIYDEYSDTNDWSIMIEDQIDKMNQYSAGTYFLLSWTLTQNSRQTFFCKPSLKDLADKANIHLGHLLYKDVSATRYPNIILVDDVKCTDVAALAMAINIKVLCRFMN